MSSTTMYRDGSRIPQSRGRQPQRGDSNLLLLPAATKLGQGNVFTGVCDSVHSGGFSVSVHPGIPPPPRADTPRADTPLEQTPPGTRPPGTRPPGADTPLGTDTPPGSRHSPGQTPPGEADSGIQSTSGRYTSYWNAFLFSKFSLKNTCKLRRLGREWSQNLSM